MVLKTLVISIIVVLAGAMSVQSAEEPIYHQFKLDNGVEVVVVPDFRSPVVVHMVWYGAGSVDEPVGKTGIAHMLEHMMFKGTQKIKPGEFSKTIARLGGQDNAFTSYDYTAYYQKIARDNLVQAVEMEADRMANLAITNDTFLPERNVVLEERNMRVDSRPVSKFFEAFNEKQYKVLPYRNPVIGWRKDIEGYTLKDAQDWYKRFYAPRNAIVILAGSIKLEEAEWLANTYYAPIKNPDVAPNRPTIKPEPLRDAPLRFTHVDERTQIPLWVRSYRAPSLHVGIAGQEKPVEKDVFGLMLFSDILGGGVTSELYQTLVVKKKLADSASASYNLSSRYESTFDIIVQPKDGVSIEVIEKEVEKVIARMQKNGTDDDALLRARMQSKGSDVFARDDLFETAYRLGAWLSVGGTLDGYRTWLSKLDNITADDIKQISNTYLIIENSATGILLPKKVN